MLYVAVHRDWGSFRLPDEIAQIIGCDEYDSTNEIRCHPILVDWIKKNPYSELKLACVPGEATDFKVLDYDGMESVIMCVDGALEYAKIWRGN